MGAEQIINNRLYTILWLMVLFFAFSNSISTAASTDGTHTLSYSTFGIAATKTIDAEYLVTGILGQSVAGHNFKSTFHTLDAGFWQGYLLPVLVGDLNNDGRVDLADLINGLNVQTGQSSVVTMEADVNGDEKINSAELIYIMRSQAQFIE